MDALSVEGLTKENALLKAALHDLTMRLCAIKVITTKVTPTCSAKLAELLELSDGCKTVNEVGN